MDRLLQDEKDKRDEAKRAALQKAEDHRVATLAGIEERKAKATELTLRFQREDEAKSLKEQTRRDRNVAEKKFAVKEEKRKAEAKRVKEERARAQVEAEAQALLENPQSAFGGKLISPLFSASANVTASNLAFGCIGHSGTQRYLRPQCVANSDCCPSRMLARQRQQSQSIMALACTACGLVVFAQGGC